MKESLRKRLEFICEFCRVKPIIINGNLRTIDKTNLTYLEPHRIIINDITFLAFNYSNEIFIENLNNNYRNSLIIIISHRLAIFHNIDRIILLKNDQSYEYGTHQELMRQSELYSTIYHLQYNEKGEGYEE